MRSAPSLIPVFFIACLTGCGVSQDNAKNIEDYRQSVNSGLIRTDQVGYNTVGSKYFVVEGATSDSFVITRNGADDAPFVGNLTKITQWDNDRVEFKAGTFDGITSPGDYTLTVSGIQSPVALHIEKEPYAGALREALRFFYFQRASIDLTEPFAGVYSRKAGHPDTEDKLYSGKSGTRNVAGGWYDAGDYGKYVVNGGVSVATLMGLHAIYPDLIKDNLAIPESGNGKSDLLDEAKVELDWMKTMQDQGDGGVYSKVAGVVWPEMIAPDKDTQQRYVFGKATNATLNFIAVMAQAARVYADYDEAFAHDCIQRAEQAFEWAVRYPDVHAPYTSKGSGNYDGGSYGDEFFWAVTELYVTTAKANYLDYLTGQKKISSQINLANFLANPTINGPADWGLGQWPTTGVTNLAYFSLLTQKNQLPAQTIQKIRSQLIAYADSILAQIGRNPYRVALSRGEFCWGSNAIAANKGVILGYAYQQTGQQAYLQGMTELLHYLFGRNATGYSYVTGFGSKPASFPHHRISASDGITPPIAGMLVGGPNAGRNDGLGYPSNLPEKTYLDIVGSYASNEVAINWNAPFVFLLGFVVQNSN